MKKIEMLLSLGLMLFLFQYCHGRKNGGEAEASVQTESKQENPAETGKHTIIVYGSHTCVHCVDFLQKLKAGRKQFTFKDVETDTANFNEMYRKVKAAKYPGYIAYPVVELDGQLMVNPSYEDLVAKLK